MFDPSTAAANYEPRPGDVPAGEYLAQLEKCRDCPARSIDPRRRLRVCDRTGRPLALTARTGTGCPRKGERRGPSPLAGFVSILGRTAATLRRIGARLSRPSTLNSQPSTAAKRLVTTCDESYVPGLVALLHSLRANAGIPWRMTVIEYGDLSAPARGAIATAARGHEIEFLPARSLGEFQFPRHWTDTPRMSPNFDKPLIWRLPYEETCVYLDADVLCLRSLEGLHESPSLSVVLQQSALDAGPAQPEYRVPGRYAWNAGVMVFRPSAEIFDGLQEHARTYEGPVAFGDQVLQNDYFATHRPALVHFLDPAWNATTWGLHRHPTVFRPDRVRLLHFAHPEKPWRDPSPHPSMRFWWELWSHYARSSRPHGGEGVRA